MILLAESSTRIAVFWKRPDCRDWNGEITGYSVRYGEEGSAEEDRAVGTNSNVDEVVTISGLTGGVVYTVEVAAVTSAGTGVYSPPQTIETPDGEYHILSLSHDIVT